MSSQSADSNCPFVEPEVLNRGVEDEKIKNRQRAKKRVDGVAYQGKSLGRAP